MYAIVDIAGQQFKVEKDQKIFVHRLESEVGDQVDFDKVLLIDNENIVVVGEPVIEGAIITAKVLEHLKGDKVIVFKKKRRKGYKVKNGHRQFFTQLLIEEIVETGGKARTVVKEKKAKQPLAEKPVAAKTIAEVSPETADVKPEVAKSEVIKEKPVTEEATPKKATAKKPAAKETKATKDTETAAEKKAEVKPKAKAAPKKAAAKSTAAKKDDKPAAAKKTKKATDKDE